jgi:hypothetical protein
MCKYFHYIKKGSLVNKNRHFPTQTLREIKIHLPFGEAGVLINTVIFG